MPMLQKQALSQYLRVRCDRYLHHSLYRKDFLEGIPLPLAGRPGVAAFRKRGLEFERQKFTELESVFPKRCLNLPKMLKRKTGVKPDAFLSNQLQANTNSPFFVFEPTISGSLFVPVLMKHLGLNPSTYPGITDLRPDVIEVMDAFSLAAYGGGSIVAPNGSVTEWDTDMRTPLRVIDMKATEHLNSSYAAEVVAYSLALAAWLEATGLDDTFVVLSIPAIWLKGTFHSFNLPQNTDPVDDRLKWVHDQLGIADAHLYGPSVLKFLTEDIPRVINESDWKNLDWGVAPTCSQCDWLGYPGWSKREILKAKDLAKKKGWSSEPELDDYCYTEASAGKLAMQIPNLTTGMRRTLTDQKVYTLPDVAARNANDPVFSEHNGLKREAPRLPRKANAILNNAHQINQHYQSAQMAKYTDLRLTINVNFDAASGMLMALGLGIDFQEPSSYNAPRQNPLARKQVATYFVDRQDPAFELAQLVDFLRTISNTIDWFGNPASYPNTGNPVPRTRANYARDNARVQVIFWEERQAKALRDAIGRHLHHLLGQGVIPAAIWLFPPEEVVGSDRTAETPPICYLKDVVTRHAILPTTINDDLVSVAEYLINFNARLSDFQWDRIGGSIPRERALEIWQQMPPKNPPMSLSQCRQQYERNVATLVHAMRQLVFDLAINHQGVLRGKAPRVRELVPTAFRLVAPDALLWLAHLGVEEGSSRLESRMSMTADPHELEARYVALRTDGLLSSSARAARLNSLGLPAVQGRHVFKVRPDSQHAKYRNEEGFVTLIPESPVGAGLLPVDRFVNVMGVNPPNFTQSHWSRSQYTPLWRLMRAKLTHFDRQRNEAVIDLSTFFQNDQRCRNDLVRCGALDLNGPMILLVGEGFPVLPSIMDVARHIGNPPVAQPDSATATALVNMNRRPGRSRIKPAARVLWEPYSLTLATNNVQMAGFDAAINGVTQKWPEKLNLDQRFAAATAIDRQLSLTWGGPGTGKTRTLVATILTDLILRSQTESPVRVFITAWTYKALAQIIMRFEKAWKLLPAPFKATLSQNSCATFLVSEGRIKEFLNSFSQGRFCGLQTVVLGEIYRTAVVNDQPDNTINYSTKRQSLLNAQGCVFEIVFGVTRQAYNLGKGGQKNNPSIDPVVELFDRIWLDESSQLAVAPSLPLLGLLSKDGAVGLFGDRLQMPPVQHVPSPKGAEHLVGSLHRYLLHRIQEDEKALFGTNNYREAFLSINYRSCEPIVAFSRAIGYEATFKAEYPDQKLNHLRLAGNPNWDLQTVPWFPLYESILDPDRACVAVTYDDGRNGQANTFEATLVAGSLLTYRASLIEQAAQSKHTFDEGKFWSESIGIVTPHRAQRAAIVSLLQPVVGAGVAPGLIDGAVDTVERFQGGERELIFISFGLGDPDLIQREEEFLFQKERINVAITRAKSKVVLFVTRDLGYHIPNEPLVVEASMAIKNFVYQHSRHETPIETVTLGGRSVNVHVRYRTYGD